VVAKLLGLKPSGIKQIDIATLDDGKLLLFMTLPPIQVPGLFSCHSGGAALAPRPHATLPICTPAADPHAIRM
jgi:hypothetical protein